jgi:hypothetical protein
MDEIIIIESKEGSGNNNQLLGVERELKNIGNLNIIKWKYNENYETKIKQLDFSNNISFIAAHKEGLKQLTKIHKDLKDKVSYNLLSHEYFQEIKTAAGFLTKIFLPSYEKVPDSTEQENHKKFISTYGVANNVTKDLIDQAFIAYNNVITKENCYIGVVIGGKVDNDEISKISIDNLAKFAVNQASLNNCQILYSFSPRSTKKNQVDFKNAIDLSKVKNQQLNNQAEKPSAYLAIMKLVSNSVNSKLIITGDSISMAYEAVKFPELIKPEQIFIAKVSNMKKSYHDSCELLKDDARANLIDLDILKIITAKSGKNVSSFNTESEIAKNIFN